MPEAKSKKRGRPTVEELKSRPWCYFCERDFDDVSYLIAHQRAKHYKCDECSRRLNTANGLVVHKQQVHKSAVQCIQNCTIEGREVVPAPEIFGMEGMPADLLAQYHQRIEVAYYKAEQEYRAKTGNPPPGTAPAANGAKRVKIETPEEIKARLAEHRAKRAAEKERKERGDGTPEGEREASKTPPDGHAAFCVAQNAAFGIPPPGMGSPMPPIQSPAQHGFPPQMHEVYPTPGPHGYPMPAQPGFPPAYGMPVGMPPQGWSPAIPPPQAYSPVNVPPYHGPPQQLYSAMPPHPQNGPPQYGGLLNRPRQSNGHSPSSPANNIAQPSSLPPALGLPARPSFDPPKVSHDGMQRMHTGQAPPLTSDKPYPPYRGPQQAQPVSQQQQQQQPGPGVDQSVADLIKDVERELAEKARSEGAAAGGVQSNEASTVHQGGASAPRAFPAEGSAPFAEKEISSGAAVQQVAPETEKAPAASKKKSKKSKDVAIKMMYDDNNTSLEEKMAALSKYAFRRSEGTEYTLGQVGAAVTGTERGENDVVDPAH